MDLTPTDWSEDIRERFKILPAEGEPEYLWPYSYNRAHCALCRWVVEPVALSLARQDDWVNLDDVRLLIGFDVTTAGFVLDLLEELHPQRPPVRERDHTTRLEAVRDALHAEIVEGVTDAVRCGDELNPRLLDYVGAWSGTYRGAALMPAAWSPLARPPVKKLTYMTFESPRPPDSPD